MSTDKVIFVGEQQGATGSYTTGSDVTGSHVIGRDHVRNRKYAMRMRNIKFRNTPSGTFSPEVTSVIASDRVRMRNWYILYYYWSSSTSTRLPKGWKGVRMPYRKLRNIHILGLFTGSWLQEVTLFSPAHFSLWQYKMLVGGILYDVCVYPFPWLSAPFIFIITYTVCCFRICCVVLQGWYF